EALFLSDTGNQGELKYRLRLHAALFIGENYERRKEIFDDFGLAYDLRSSIVHGNKSDGIVNKIKTRPEGHWGDNYKVEEFTDRIREYIRYSIVRMIHIEQKPQPDWQRMVLE